MEEVRQACIEGRVPDFSHLDEDTATSGQQPAVSDDEDVLTGADLTGEALEICEPFPIPGTRKKVYVFPATSEDLVQLLRWSLGRSDVEINADPEVPAVEVVGVKARVAQVELQVLQAVLVCRRGPSRKAKRCFSLAEAPALRRKLGHRIIGDIYAVSERLSGGEELLGPGTRRFFSAAGTCLRIWSSRSVGWDDCPAGLRDTTEQLISLVSRAVSQQSLGSGLLADLAEL